MAVAVISSTGKVLMPTREYRARKLLRSGKAVKHSYHPFTIQLTEREDGEIQPVELCMDTGYLHIGVSVKSEKHEYLALQADTLPDEKHQHDARRMYCRKTGETGSGTGNHGLTTAREKGAGLPHP